MSKIIAGKKGIGKCLVNKSISSKLANYHKNGQVRGTWADKITKKFGAAAGGKVKLVITGSAPIDPSVLNMMKVLLGVQIIEG